MFPNNYLSTDTAYSLDDNKVCINDFVYSDGMQFRPMSIDIPRISTGIASRTNDQETKTSRGTKTTENYGAVNMNQLMNASGED